MDRVQSPRRIESPNSFDISIFPPESFELICQFLSTEDLVRLSMVSTASRSNLSQRILPIGLAGLDKALSGGRADDASRMIRSLSKWLASLVTGLTPDQEMNAWKCLQIHAQHACLNEEQRGLALRQIFFYSCQKIDEINDEKLSFLRDTRAIWYCKNFPEGTIYASAHPCGSYAYVSNYLDDSYRPDEVDDNSVRPPLPASREEACMGAAIEAIRLHDNNAERVTSFTKFASILKKAFENLRSHSRVALTVDLIKCLKTFPAEQVLPLLEQLDEVLAMASAEEKPQLQKAVDEVRLCLHRYVDPDICLMM